MRDEITPVLGIVGQIRLHHLPTPQITILNHATPSYRVSVERIGPAEDGEVRQADFVRVSIDQGRHSKVAGIDGLLGYLQFEIPAVVDFGPLELAVVSNKERAFVIGSNNRDILSKRAWTRNRSASKFHANAALSSAGVIFRMVEPHQIRDPVRM